MNVAALHQSASSSADLSFAEAIAAIGLSAQLDVSKKTHWSTSLRQMAAYFDKPVDLVPARIVAIAASLKALHHEPLGVHSKTLANHKSNVRSALAWLKTQSTGRASAEVMSPSFRILIATLPDRHRRDLISPFFRFLSSRGVAPCDVTDALLTAYGDYRCESGRAIQRTHIRRIARIWNALSPSEKGEGSVELREPAYAARSQGLPWEEFPEQLRADIEAYCSLIAGVHRTADGKRRRAVAPATIATRRRELVAAVRTAVAEGVDVTTLGSLRSLLEPSVVETILEAYWKRNGERPALYTVDLASKFLSLARATAGFDAMKLERLQDIRDELEQYRPSGLTDKNRTLVRRVLNTPVWSSVVDLPRRLLATARTAAVSKPARAAVLAKLAVAIRILTVAPIRIGNVASLRLGKNLVRPGGPRSSYLLTIPDYDVKNRVPLDFPLDAETTAMIDEYVQVHRSKLVRGVADDRLFPGTASDHKAAQTLGAQVSQRLQKEIGLAVTPHQFRHAAAAIMLKAEPGNYELVRRVLGHKNITTTTRFYIGLETMEATRRFGAMLMGMMSDSPAAKRRARG